MRAHAIGRQRYALPWLAAPRPIAVRLAALWPSAAWSTAVRLAAGRLGAGPEATTLLAARHRGFTHAFCIRAAHMTARSLRCTWRALAALPRAGPLPRPIPRGAHFFYRLANFPLRP